jgi:hypothetical protein
LYLSRKFVMREKKALRVLSQHRPEWTVNHSGRQRCGWFGLSDHIQAASRAPTILCRKRIAASRDIHRRRSRLQSRTAQDLHLKVLSRMLRLSRKSLTSPPPTSRSPSVVMIAGQMANIRIVCCREWPSSVPPGPAWAQGWTLESGAEAAYLLSAG